MIKEKTQQEIPQNPRYSPIFIELISQCRAAAIIDNYRTAANSDQWRHDLAEKGEVSPNHR